LKGFQTKFWKGWNFDSLIWKCCSATKKLAQNKIIFHFFSFAVFRSETEYLGVKSFQNIQTLKNLQDFQNFDCLNWFDLTFSSGRLIDQTIFSEKNFGNEPFGFASTPGQLKNKIKNVQRIRKKIFYLQSTKLYVKFGKKICFWAIFQIPEILQIQEKNLNL
jgi:hypothetical protein